MHRVLEFDYQMGNLKNFDCLKLQLRKVHTTEAGITAASGTGLALQFWYELLICLSNGQSHFPLSDLEAAYLL